ELASVGSFAARSIAPDGKERTYSRANLVDVPAIPDFVLYASSRVMTLQANVVPGTVFECRYTVITRDLRMARFQQVFDGPLPTRHARLTVVAPSDWHVASVAVRRNEIVDLPSTTTTVGDTTVKTWERRDLAALPNEPFSAEPRALETFVGVRLVRWTVGDQVHTAPVDPIGLSAWLYRLTLAPDPLASRPAELARSLIKDAPADPTERARLLYDWVRDHVAYCAVSIGMGGWRPHAAGEVERVHYGDCKDKANLLHDMLDAVHIPSDLVVIHAHEGQPLLFEPVEWMTNHAILQVRLPSGRLLVDPTSRAVPFGQLPINDQEAEYLPLASAGLPIGRAPASAPDENASRLALDLAVDGRDLTGRFVAELRGFEADQLRSRFLLSSPEQRGKSIAETLGMGEHRIKHWHVDDGGAPTQATPVAITGALALPNAWPDSGLVLVRVASFLAAAVPALPRGERRGPLVFHCRRQREDTVRLALDDGTDVSLPPATELDRPFGHYALTWTREPGHLVVKRTLVMNEHVFAATQYGDVKQFFDDILAAEARALTIRRSSHP
ncbi:MAG TPA: DUF3857 domain-containing protein, partial [Polyangia bacterium]|nr:DUF3857 domain-containing protein [Polyangia bacterium]